MKLIEKLKLEFNAMSREEKARFLLTEVKANVEHYIEFSSKKSPLLWLHRWSAIKKHYYVDNKTSLCDELVDLIDSKLDAPSRSVVTILEYINTDMIEDERKSQSVLLNTVLRLRRFNEEDNIYPID